MVLLRFYVDTDYPAVEAVLKETGLYIEPFDTRENFSSVISQDPQAILVAEVEGAVVGMVIAVHSPYLSGIWHLCVSPAYQHKGVGSQLLAQAEQTLAVRGAKTVSLYVKEDDAALQAYYTKAGYELWKHGIVYMSKRL